MNDEMGTNGLTVPFARVSLGELVVVARKASLFAAFHAAQSQRCKLLIAAKH